MCGRSACTVRREGEPQALPTPITNFFTHPFRRRGLTQFGDIILKIEVWADVHSVAQKAGSLIAEEVRAAVAARG